MGIKEKIDPGKAIMCAYAAISVGDVLVGFVSQLAKKQEESIIYFLCNHCHFYSVVFYGFKRWFCNSDGISIAQGSVLVQAFGHYLLPLVQNNRY